MINKSKCKEPIKILDKEERHSSFKEVEFTLTDESAVNESLRCLNCKNSPCISGCPVGINIPKFINYISQGLTREAYKVICESNFLPSICGRVCPQEKQCEAKCVKGKIGEPVAIGRLEKYIADKMMFFPKRGKVLPSKNKKVAVIGSGPSGLTCAGELGHKGYKVDIFEALHTPGGVLAYGIPSFRLPKDVLEFEIKELEKIGVRIFTNIVIGKTLSIDDLFDKGYNAIYIATGAGLPKFMGIPGEGLAGVYSANEFLTRINLMKAYDSKFDTPTKLPKKIVIIGGGNVAMDAARCAVRLGAEKVSVIYRRGESDMPARKEEISHAKEEGVEFIFFKSPIEFIGENGILKSVKCVSMEHKGEDQLGKKLFVPLYDEKLDLETDMAIIAIGNKVNRLLVESEADLKFDKDGKIIADKSTARTSRKYVYAGGDAVTGAATVILAMEAGKRAAHQIDEDLSDDSL